VAGLDILPSLKVRLELDPLGSIIALCKTNRQLLS
jgi:hypothetical protein